LITQLEARFGVSVSQMAAALAVPVIEAAGGAAINLLFIDHFQDLARGHLVARRPEHGPIRRRWFGQNMNASSWLVED